MRVIRQLLTLSLFAFLSASPVRAAAGANVTVQAILIEVTAGGSSIDSALQRHAAILRRAIRDGALRQASTGADTINAPGEGSISLGGHRIAIEVASATAEQLDVRVHWTRGDRSMAPRTRVAGERGVSQLLLGPPAEEGQPQYAVIVIAR